MQLVKGGYTLYITVSLLNTTPLLQALELDRLLAAKTHCRDLLSQGKVFVSIWFLNQNFRLFCSVNEEFCER